MARRAREPRPVRSCRGGETLAALGPMKLRGWEAVAVDVVAGLGLNDADADDHMYALRWPFHRPGKRLTAPFGHRSIIRTLWSSSCRLPCWSRAANWTRHPVGRPMLHREQVRLRATVARTSPLLIVHDRVESFGVGVEIAACMGQTNLGAQTRRSGSGRDQKVIRK